MSLIKTLFYSMPLTLLLASAFAAPGPAPAPVPQTSNPVPAVRRSQCVSEGAPAHIEWAIYVVNTTMPSNQSSGTWGGRLLDSVNGKTGCAPTSWQAQVDDANPQGVGCTFNTPGFCIVNQISDTIQAASSENDQKVIAPGGGPWVIARATHSPTSSISRVLSSLVLPKTWVLWPNCWAVLRSSLTCFLQEERR